MIRPKEFYNTGIEYFHNAIAFSKSNKFGEVITLNVIAMSAEYLLSAMLLKNGIEHHDAGLENILCTLEKNKLIPEEVKIKASEISKQSPCKEPNEGEFDIENQIDSLRGIKVWADESFKLVKV
ncbi:hypothetical protein [Labilibacter marinus]|uniref:hypothetical protein n=1 Tax=Labilibacter marinus TaxID=1477105 RepID=UPI000950062D|nr:hypothetical protein [Labilibacter marinus]